MTSAKLYNALINSDLATLKFQSVYNIGTFNIDLSEADVVGNILEEWLDKWMTNKGIPHIHNKKQASPDFWLNPNDLNSDWLEIKSFTGSPNFDVAAFRSFINLIIENPCKLHSKHLLIKYKSDAGIVTIEKIWLKKPLGDM